MLARTARVLTQKQKDKNKLYALHAPEVECLAKGKARKPYAFGVKVSIVTTLKEGVVVGARSMPGNPHVGHTLAESLERAEIFSDVKPEIVVVDRGYRGVDIPGVHIWRSGQKRGVTRTIRAMIHRRSAIEPTIGHVKSDGKLGRYWLKDAIGDASFLTGDIVQGRLAGFFALTAHLLTAIEGIRHQNCRVLRGLLPRSAQ